MGDPGVVKEIFVIFLTCHEMTVWSGLEVGRNTPDLARLRN